MKPVDQYILQFEEEVKNRLQECRALFFECFPDVQESIRYNMPSFCHNNYHLYFAAYKNHIGFYPVSRGSDFESEIQPYRAKNTQDSLHFLHKQPLPTDLIKKIIRYHLGKPAKPR